MGEETQRLIKLVCVPIRGLATTLRVPYDTVRGWSSGRADPSPENRQALAKFMREHARKLVAAAEELEG